MIIEGNNTSRRASTGDKTYCDRECRDRKSNEVAQRSEQWQDANVTRLGGFNTYCITYHESQDRSYWNRVMVFAIRWKGHV